MDERYRIILTIKDDLPFVAKEFEPETTLDEAIQWMKDNRKEVYITPREDWFETVLFSVMKYNVDAFVPASSIVDKDGVQHIVSLKFERKQVDRDQAEIQVHLFNGSRIKNSMESKIHTLPNKKLSIDELDEILGWNWYENERTT